MPFMVSCPNCKMEYKLVDRVRGKKLRCKSCQMTFRAGPKLQSPQPVEPLLIQPVTVPVIVDVPAVASPLPIEAFPVEPLPAEMLNVEMMSGEPMPPVPDLPISVEPVLVQPIPVQPIPVQPIPVQPIPVEPIPVEPIPAAAPSIQDVPAAPTAAPSVPIDIVLPQESPVAPVSGSSSSSRLGSLASVPLVNQGSGDPLLHQSHDLLAPQSSAYGSLSSSIVPSSFGQPVQRPRDGKTRRERYEESKPQWSGINWNGGAVAAGVGFLIMMLGIFGTIHSFTNPNGQSVLYFGAIIGGFLQMCYGFSNLK